MRSGVSEPSLREGSGWEPVDSSANSSFGKATEANTAEFAREPAIGVV